MKKTIVLKDCADTIYYFVQYKDLFDIYLNEHGVTVESLVDNEEDTIMTHKKHKLYLALSGRDFKMLQWGER